jgi:hypothetical protein
MKTMALIAAMVLIGCGADPGADPGAANAAAAAPRLDDAAALAGRGLTASSLPEIQLLATPGGRDLLSRVVSCALPRGAAITAITRDGTPYSFAGALGLAPGWAHHAPTTDERRRVTACMRARGAGGFTA